MKMLSNTLILILLAFFLLSFKSYNKPTVISYGSSSFYYMYPHLKADLEAYNVEYISNSIGGQIIETMSALQGSNPIELHFEKNIIKGNNIPNPVIIKQHHDLGSLQPKGKFEVILSNDVKGTLDLDEKIFSTKSDISEETYQHLKVNFGFNKYKYNAIHILNIGKNNITMGNYTSDQIFNGITNMVNYLEINGNYKYIICGYYIDRGMSLDQKVKILEINKKLSDKYREKYLDIQDYLISTEIWEDINIRPTPNDILYQKKYELAPSLSRDPKHLSSKVDSKLSYIIKNKIIAMNYFN